MEPPVWRPRAGAGVSFVGPNALAVRLRDLTAGRALFLINDRLDVALAAGADGVQLAGQTRIAAAERRRGVLGRRVIDAPGAGRVRQRIKSRRPDVCLLLNANPDVTFHEINNAVDRPLPLWRYHAGEAAKTSRSAYPNRPVAINCVMFWDIPYRFNAEQPGMVQLSLAQVIANGANPYAYVLGHTANQPDRKNFAAVRQMMRFHQANERWYEGLQPAAQILLVAPAQAIEAYGDEGPAKAQAAFRGAYRALVESHLPFDVLPDAHLAEAQADGRLARYAAIVLPNAAALSDEQAALLDACVEQGCGLGATFETATRFTMDLNAVPVLKKLTHLPVVVDPSHGTGHWEYVEAMARAAVAAGADGLIIEVHPRPAEALSDGPQSLKPERFAQLMARVRRVAEAVDRDV